MKSKILLSSFIAICIVETLRVLPHFGMCTGSIGFSLGRNLTVLSYLHVAEKHSALSSTGL
jgi:hypothetical protein